MIEQGRYLMSDWRIVAKAVNAADGNTSRRLIARRHELTGLFSLRSQEFIGGTVYPNIMRKLNSNPFSFWHRVDHMMALGQGFHTKEDQVREAIVAFEAEHPETDDRAMGAWSLAASEYD